MRNKAILNDTCYDFKNTFKPLVDIVSQRRGVWLKVSCARLSICFVHLWNLDPRFQLVLDNREHTWGSEASSNQVMFFGGGKKKPQTIKSRCWSGDRPRTKSFWSHVELDEGLQTKSSKRKRNSILWRPSLVSLLSGADSYSGGVGHQQSPLNPNDSAERGVRTSPHPLPRNQRMKYLEWIMGHNPGLMPRGHPLCRHLTVETTQFHFHAIFEDGRILVSTCPQ